MTYVEAMAYLYERLPVFHKIGARAYKPGLETTRALCSYLRNPQEKYPSIHIAGTNGKGSVSNMLAAVFQKSGYKTGLYTSPHLKTFSERIRINGAPVSEEFISGFVTRLKPLIEQINPSFFEVTVAMAFEYFARERVDVAVIETGLGGRLDSTNIITPVLSLITNIGMDHARQLGDTLPAIAREKAGIIKYGVQVVVSEKQDLEIQEVFAQVAAEKKTSLFYGTDYGKVTDDRIRNGARYLKILKTNGDKNTNIVNYSLDLLGNYQRKNLLGVLTAIDCLKEAGWALSEENVKDALASVTSLTGFTGRWTLLSDKPFIVADTGHNLPGFQEALSQFLSVPAACRHFVIGFVNDKDITSMLDLLPVDAARYYFCAPSNSRALAPEELQKIAGGFGLRGEPYANVNLALAAARQNSSPEDAIYVGGSTFVVADVAEL